MRKPASYIKNRTGNTAAIHPLQIIISEARISLLQSQKALVDIVRSFTPKIVKMDGPAPKPWMKGKGMVNGE